MRIALEERKAVHERSGRVLAESLETPRTMFGRGLGLMFRKDLPAGRGMWINPCSGIHMMFMNFPIDAVFLDSRERVKKVYRRLPRWYGVVWWEIGAHSVLELPPGSTDRIDLERGDQILIG
jgi:uncharacterized membrane protein (UPF0127 family)